MKKMKWMSVAMSAFTLALAGCGADRAAGGSENTAAAAADEEEITIRVAWWGNQDRHDKTIEVIELFEEHYPNITVEAEFTDWDGYWQRLSTQAAGNNLPDVIQMDDARLNEYYTNDLIVDLTQFVESGEINLDNVDDIYLSSVRSGDSLLGIPLGANAQVLTYNKTLMEELGLEFPEDYTYEDLKEIALEAREILESQGEDFFGIDIGNDSTHGMFMAYARQNGQSLFNEDGTGIGFDKEILVEFLTWVQDMVNDGAAPAPEVRLAYLDGANSMLQAGSVLAQFTNSNQIIGFADGTEYELAQALTPTLEGGEYGNWIRSSMLFSVSSQSQEQEAAALFIDFFTNSMEANEILQAERGVPISSEIREHLAPMVSDTVRKTFDYLELVAENSREADSLPPAVESEVRDSFNRHSEALLFNQITPEVAADLIIEDTIRLLS